MSFMDLDIDEGGEFLKLKSGEVVTFQILSESPSKEIVHWDNRKKTKCLGKDCGLCATGNKAKQRWLMDVWDRKSQSVKKMEFGPMIASQLKGIAELMAESQKTIRNTDIRIKTTGSDLETEYTVLPVPEGPSLPLEVKEKYEVPF